MRFAHVWFCSERDRATLALPLSGVLPNIVEVPDDVGEDNTQSVTRDSKVVLMVGSLWYGPNRAGIEWFLEHCWPRIRHVEPNSVLRLVGAAPPEMRALWQKHPGVEAPGFVKDLDAEYLRATCTIAPIFSGGGSQIKVLESLVHGRIPVTTPYVAEAFAPFLSSDRLLAVAESADVMASRCIDALRQSESAQTVFDKAAPVLKAHFSWEIFRDSVRDGVEMALQARRAIPSKH